MEKKQKILHIVEAMGGGVFTYIVELANGLCDEYDIEIAFGIRPETPENYEEYFKEGIGFNRIQNFTRSINLIKDFKATLELKRLIKKFEPDIVHLHSSKAGAIGRLLLRSKKYKMFYTPHGYSFLMQNASALKKVMYKVIEWVCGRTGCVTVACGKSEGEIGDTVSKHSTYINNGINMEKLDVILKEPVLRGKNHPFTVYTLGRINYQKNPEKFNEIAKQLPDVRFMWIGEGDMRDCLTSDNISITGWANNAVALDIAKSGDVFMLASRWEGLPIALQEAMYMRKPCIVSNVVGNRDMVINGVTGYICNTAEEFVEAIKKIRDGDNSEIIENAYTSILTEYNSRRLCEKYSALYKG